MQKWSTQKTNKYKMKMVTKTDENQSNFFFWRFLSFFVSFRIYNWSVLQIFRIKIEHLEETSIFCTKENIRTDCNTHISMLDKVKIEKIIKNKENRIN